MPHRCLDLADRCRRLVPTLRPGGGVLTRFYAASGEDVVDPMDVSFGLDDVDWGLVYVRVHYQFTDSGVGGSYTNQQLAMQLMSVKETHIDNASGGVSTTKPHSVNLWWSKELGYNGAGASRFSTDFVFNVSAESMLGYLFRKGERIRLYEYAVRTNLTWGAEVAVAPVGTIYKLAGVVA